MISNIKKLHVIFKNSQNYHINYIIIITLIIFKSVQDFMNQE